MSSVESELETARNNLSSTIDELVHRVSPKTIVDRQVTTTKAHFVDTDSGKPRPDNIAKVVGAVVGFIVLMAVIRKIVR